MPPPLTRRREACASCSGPRDTSGACWSSPISSNVSSSSRPAGLGVISIAGPHDRSGRAGRPRDRPGAVGLRALAPTTGAEEDLDGPVALLLEGLAGIRRVARRQVM